MIRGRVALVLGAGGPVGHAYHAGVLSALDLHGWDARGAELVIGTSAGAQVGALVRAGLHGRDLFARAAGESLSEDGAAIARHFQRPSQRPKHRVLPAGYAPASLPYLRRVWQRPLGVRVGPLIAALLPKGEVSLEPMARGFRTLFGHEWPSRPLWVAAADLHSGDAVAFGKPGHPTADVGSAVSCSCAVPALCRPVLLGDRSYVDGGVLSATHLDLIDGDFDCAIISSPLSMFSVMRLALRRELALLRQRGIRTLVFEPAAAARRAMGFNPMDERRMPAVAKAAFAEARAQVARE